MIKLLSLVCVLSFLCVSCSGIKPIHGSDPEKETNLDWKSSGSSPEPKVLEPSQPPSDQVGPVSPTTSTENLSAREPVIALILGPGLNRTAAHISFLRMLEQRGVKVRLIQGQELGAVVAALYARYQSAERVEWFFYKYFRKNERASVLTSSWRQSIEEELLSSLGKDACKEMTLESLKIDYVLPLYSMKEKKVQYLRRGPLCAPLLQSLTPIVDAKDYSASFEWGLFNSSALKKAGADLVIGVDVLGNKLLFRKENQKLKELYSKVRNIRNIEKKYVDHFVSLPVDDMPMDGLENLPLVSKKSLLYSDKAVKEIVEKIKKWKENNP